MDSEQSGLIFNNQSKVIQNEVCHLLKGAFTREKRIER